jgi:hypothetical protein
MNLAEAIKSIQRLNTMLAAPAAKILLRPVGELEKEIKERVFIEGLNAKRNKIGNYSEGWAEVRTSRGLQVDFVDLKFTGQLRESINTKVAGSPDSSDTAVMYITDDEVYEKKYKPRNSVFDPTPDEFANLALDVEFFLRFEIDKAIK